MERVQVNNPIALATMSIDGAAIPVIEISGRFWSLDQISPDLLKGDERGLIALFDDWSDSLNMLKELAPQVSELAPPLAISPESSDFLTPLRYPHKVLCTGTNYYDHVHSVGHLDFSKESSFPAFFSKPPTTSLVGGGSTVQYPKDSKEFDWEIELAVIIGKPVKRVSAEEAMGFVAGYAVALDMSARDFQRNQKHFVKMDLCLGKAFDSACPLGPKIVPSEFVADPHDLSLKLWVNGEIQQDSNTQHMIWSIGEQIEEHSKNITLEAGDILLTGTPRRNRTGAKYLSENWR